MVRTYHLVLFHSIRVIAVLFMAVTVLNIVFMLVDWITGAGWGYPLWSLPIAALFIVVGVLFASGATVALRRLR